ncbi:hypothetical protein [Streptosporangium sp. 'caverna']|uniref:hypothetical protein n=1 Tax=Streptosporangium sp. 'caverna' TaxID=2202249 RepID=UPI000D7D6BE0|nr:hypothetical protein [Streptosporangium sp. 'caverna']AWS43111.1 hypothetical protein DKM19_18750 [Streptosporangium sp. 'caverna']
MTGVLGMLGDRVLARLVPKATAKADTSYYAHCYCRERSKFRKLCFVVGGTTGCGACTAYALCGS